MKRAIKALRYIKKGGIRRAVRFLMTKTPPPHVDAAFVDASVRPLFPQLAGGTIDDLLPSAWAACADTADNTVYTIEAVGKYINSRRDDAAAGVTGLAPRTFKDIWHRSDVDQQSAICQLLQRIGNGYVPTLWRRLRAELARIRGIPIPKAPKPGYRPIGVGEILLVVADGVLASANMDVLKQACGGNLAIAVKRGAEVMAHCGRALGKVSPTLALVSLDARNAFGTVSRRKIISRLVYLIGQGLTGLRPILRRVLQMYTAPSTMTMAGTAGDEFTIDVVEGNVQGLPLAVFLYCIAHAEALEEFKAAVPDHIKPFYALTTVADDINLYGNPSHLPILFNLLRASMARVGVIFNDDKTRAYRGAVDDLGHEELCDFLDSIGAPYRNLTDAQRGVTSCGAYIGTHAFQRGKLEGKLDELKALLAEFEDLVRAAGVHPPADGTADRTLQAAFTVIRLCGPSRLHYWGGVTEPHIFGPYGNRADEEVFSFLARMLQWRAEDSTLINGNTAEALVDKARCLRLQVGLASRYGGLGVQGNGGLRHQAAYAASFSDAVPLIAKLMATLVLDNPPEPGAPRPLLLSVTLAARDALRALQGTNPTPSAHINEIHANITGGAHFEIGHAQKGLNQDIDESNFDSLLALGCSSAWARFKLRSQADEAASAWLNLIPSFWNDTVFNDRDFTVAVHNRLCLHPLAAPLDGSPRVDINCAWCLRKPTPEMHILNDAHIFLCKGASFNEEHHRVRDAIIKGVNDVARTAEYGTLEVRREPPLLSLSCVEPLSDQERTAALRGKSAQLWPRVVKMDLVVKHIGREDNVFQHNLYDVTITSPPGQWTSTDASEVVSRSRPLDHFIDAAEKDKYFHFDASFKAAGDSNTSFFPLAFDRSGRAGAATADRLRHLKKTLTDLSGATASRHSVGQSLTDRISVALQTGIARHIAATRQLHRRILLVAAAAAGAPPAPGPAPGGGNGGAGGQG